MEINKDAVKRTFGLTVTSSLKHKLEKHSENAELRQA